MLCAAPILRAKSYRHYRRVAPSDRQIQGCEIKAAEFNSGAPSTGHDGQVPARSGLWKLIEADAQRRVNRVTTEGALPVRCYIDNDRLVDKLASCWRSG